jgi:hypothetical protein
VSKIMKKCKKNTNGDQYTLVSNFINLGNVLELTVLFITNYKLRAITRRIVSNANTFPYFSSPKNFS